MGVIFVSDRAKEVWKYILGISAVIGALIFLYFNFINMFAYLQFFGNGSQFITIFVKTVFSTSEQYLFEFIFNYANRKNT